MMRKLTKDIEFLFIFMKFSSSETYQKNKIISRPRIQYCRWNLKWELVNSMRLSSLVYKGVLEARPHIFGPKSYIESKLALLEGLKGLPTSKENSIWMYSLY